MEKNTLTIWYDFINTPHVPFLTPIYKYLSKRYNSIITARDFAETISLLKKNSYTFKTYGKHHGSSKLLKIIGLLQRDIILLKNLPNFDVSISCGSANATHITKIRNGKSITFDDNDISPNWLYAKFADYLFFPKCIGLEKICKREGIKKDKLFLYNGYKEDICVADFIPDLNFQKNIPFNNFVTVRPENIMASYLKQNVKSIVPRLLQLFRKKNVNVLYLLRYQSDKTYAKGYDNVYIPPEPLNGLDVCYYSKAVLTGSGTFAREAACMGTPSVSFFPEKLLAVDQKMVNDGWMFYSRDPQEIVEYALNSKKRKVDLSRSKKVQKEVFDIVEGILEEIESKKG